MPSVKNPNTVGRNRTIAQRAKARKATSKTLRMSRLPDRIAQADTRRGARTGLLPTSGPNARLSKKKERKVEKQIAHALRRKAELEAKKEVEMQDVTDVMKSSKKELKKERDAAMDALEKMDIK
ncbi:unnamed protein product [Discula destructiva]